jgi:hypothetical protein
MKIKKNGKVINLTESDLKRIVKEQSKESLKMEGIEVEDPMRNESNDLKSRVSEIEEIIELFDGFFGRIFKRFAYIELILHELERDPKK